MFSSHVMTKKRKFVADGLFYAELKEFFKRELSGDNFCGLEVRNTPSRCEVILKVGQPQKVLGERGKRIRELSSMVKKRFQISDDLLEVYVERVNNLGLSALAQAESLKYKLLSGLAVRRAAYSVMRYVMDSGAKGVEVIVSGKLRAARAKAMKFKDGFMIYSGHPVTEFVDESVAHAKMKQGVLGIKVRIMKPYDPTGKMGPTHRLPDNIVILEPEDEVPIEGPSTEDFKPNDQAITSDQPQMDVSVQTNQQ